MTNEEAIMILNPETRRETMQKIPVFERIDADQAACRLAVAALRAQAEAEKNEPLTLDELREMDGDPVWTGNGECYIVNAKNRYASDKWRGFRMLNSLCERGAYRRNPKEAAQ